MIPVKNISTYFLLDFNSHDIINHKFDRQSSLVTILTNQNEVTVHRNISAIELLSELKERECSNPEDYYVVA